MDFHAFRLVPSLSQLLHGRLLRLLTFESRLTRLTVDSLHSYALYDHVPHGVLLTQLHQYQVKRMRQSKEGSADCGLLTVSKFFTALNAFPSSHSETVHQIEDLLVQQLLLCYHPQQITSYEASLLWFIVSLCGVRSSADTLLSHFPLQETVDLQSNTELCHLVNGIMNTDLWKPWGAAQSNSIERQRERVVLEEVIGKEKLAKGIKQRIEETKKDLAATRKSFENLVSSSISLAPILGESLFTAEEISMCVSLQTKGLYGYYRLVHTLGDKALQAVMDDAAMTSVHNVLIEDLYHIYQTADLWRSFCFYHKAINTITEDTTTLLAQVRPYHSEVLDRILPTLTSPTIAIQLLLATIELDSTPEELHMVVRTCVPLCQAAPSFTLPQCAYLAMVVERLIQKQVPQEWYQPLNDLLSREINKERLAKEGGAKVVFLLLHRAPTVCRTTLAEVEEELWSTVPKEAENGFRSYQLEALLSPHRLSDGASKRIREVLKTLPQRESSL